MKFLIIIPTYNEENLISFCLQSIENQIYKNFEIGIVNDGSTDETSKKIQDFASKTTLKIKIINLEKSQHEPGQKVVNAFYKGLEQFDIENFDIICKFDSDVIFPPNYLQRISDIYLSDNQIGMVSGIVKIQKNNNSNEINFDFSNEKNHWIFENISSKNHIRGPIKSYRKKCFEEIGGLHPILGWDNIDCLLAEKNGWKIKTDPNLWVKHLKPTSYKYKKQKYQKLGIYFYNLGLNGFLCFVSALKATIFKGNFYGFFVIINTFLKQKHSITLNNDEIRFIRKKRTQEFLKKINFFRIFG